MLQALRKETNQSFCCALACENRFHYRRHGCEGELGGGCLGHRSRTIAKRTWGHSKVPSSTTISTKVLPMQRRYDEVRSKGPYYSRLWLPPALGASGRVLIATMLRDPRERLRSKYYYRQVLGFDDAVNHSFDEWLSLLQVKDPAVKAVKMEACCEYIRYLGSMNVARAKYILATRFDIVGILENIDGTMLELAHQLGKDPHSPVEIEHARGGSYNKLQWTDQQYAKASDLVSQDLELYNFAKELSHARLMKAWGSEAALGQAIEERVLHKDVDQVVNYCR